jgi:hypothetical protein
MPEEFDMAVGARIVITIRPRTSAVTNIAPSCLPERIQGVDIFTTNREDRY